MTGSNNREGDYTRVSYCVTMDRILNRKGDTENFRETLKCVKLELFIAFF